MLERAVPGMFERAVPGMLERGGASDVASEEPTQLAARDHMGGHHLAAADHMGDHHLAGDRSEVSVGGKSGHMAAGIRDAMALLHAAPLIGQVCHWWPAS